MTEQEFPRIVNMLRVYPKCCTDNGSIAVWYDSLKNYGYSEIYQAVQDYMKVNTFAPVPANLIALIPKAKGTEFKPKYDDSGRLLIQCRRCRDTGLITYTDKDGSVTGFPCDCPAGHSKYQWGWLGTEDQEEYIRKNNHHGEIVGEDWYKLNQAYERRLA